MNREEEKPEKEGKKENDYYTSQPSFGSKKTSRFWHQISRDVRIFVVIAACIVFYFALLRMTNISEVFGKIYQVLKPIIYGLVIAYLLNPIVKLVDTHFEPWIKRKFPRIKNAGGISRGAGILLAIVVMFALIVVQYDDTGTLPQYKRYDPYCAEPAESFYREDDRGDEYRSIDYWTDGRGGPQRSK